MRRAALVLALLTLLWAVDAAVGAGVFFHHDLRHHHLPWRVWAVGEWSLGRVPLWAPGVANGFPLMADGQAGVFYLPTMLLFAMLPAGLALNWSILGHMWWAGLGTWFLLRALGRSEEGALLGAVGLAFGGFLATHALYLGFQNAVAWVPWLLWAVRRERWAVAGLGAFMLMVAGHPQAAVFGMLLGSWCAVAWSPGAGSGRPPRDRWPWQFGLAMTLALLTASPQLLATLELVGFSLRDGGVGAAFGGIGSLPPWELVNGVLPGFFGIDRPADIAQTYYHRGDGYWGTGANHWEMAFFLGISAVVLAVAGARRAWGWGALAVLALVLMLGRYTPVWPLLRQLPGLSGFRFPVRFALWLVVAVSVLGAFGLDGLLAASQARRRRVARRLVGLAVAGLVMAGVARGALSVAEGGLRAQLAGHFERQAAAPLPPLPEALPPLARAALPEPEPEDPARIPQKVDRVMAGLARATSPLSVDVLAPVAVVLALAGLSWFAQGLGRRRTGLLVAFLLYGELWRFGAGYHGRVSPTLVDAEPGALAPILAADGVPDAHRVTVVDRRQDPALDTELVSASLGLLHGFRDVIITSPLLLVRNEALLAVAGLDVGDRGTVKVERLAAHPGLVDLLGLRWLLSVHDLSTVGYPSRAELSGGVGLFENEDPLPRAFLVGCVHNAPEDPWGALLGADLRHEAVVEAKVAVPACGTQPRTRPGTATVTDTRPQSLTIAVEADRPALLVQNDTWYPGWVATLDGEPVPLVQTDLVFRGVPVPAGKHEVVLRYLPAQLRGALMVAPATLLVLLGWALSGATRRRARSRARSGRGRD